MESYLTWKEVLEVHGTVAAVAADGDFIKSILCGESSHDDEIADNQLLYKIPYRKYYEKSVVRFNHSMIVKREISVFLKIASDKWVNKGIYCIENIELSSGSWVIKLKITLQQ